MATEKLDVDLSVKVVDDNNLHSPKSSTKKSINKNRLFLGIGLLIWLIIVTRIPYIGTYVDAYVFELLFGYAKFIIYLYVLMFLVLALCKTKLAWKMLKKRFLFALALIVIGTILCLSVFYVIFDSYSGGDFIKQINQYMNLFAHYGSCHDYQHFVPSFISGGIFSQIFIGGWEFATYGLVIFVAVLIFISGVFMFINKSQFSLWQVIRRWLIKILGGNTYGNSYDELKPSAGDVKPVVYLKAEIEQEGLKIDQETPPLNFLTDTSVNHYFQGKKDGEKYKGVITKFLKNIDVKANYEKTTIMPLFMEITFEVEDKAMIDEILHHQQEILKELGVELFNITFKNNLINFEIPLANPSKISIKSVLTSLSKINNNQAVIGVDYESAPILLDINRMPRTIIVGKKGSGAAMLLSNIVGSLAYINSPKTLEFIVLSPMGDKSVKHFDALPHLKYPISTDLNECKTRMLEIKNEIEKRYQMFETIGSSNIDEFNKFQKTPTAHLKRWVVFISSFDKIIAEGLDNIELLKNILGSGPRAGVSIILLSVTANNETLEPTIYDQMDAKFILKLESQNESLRMFDNYRGIQLYGHGDGYFFDVKAEKRTRFQACYMNAEELNQIINIIQTFYSIKDN